jgi:hypothetical protein
MELLAMLVVGPGNDGDLREHHDHDPHLPDDHHVAAAVPL